MKTPFKLLALLVLTAALALPSLSKAQALPTGVTIRAIYDTTNTAISFRKAGIHVAGMVEIPGKPKHFIVAGHYGLLFTLYPDTNAQGVPLDTIVAPMTYPVHKYTRTQVADFRLWVMKGYEFGLTGITIDPNFKVNRRFYVLYNRYGQVSQYNVNNSNTSGNEGPGNASALTQLDRYIMSADYQTVTRDTAIMSFGRGTGYGSSNLRFGTDGMLYIANNSYNTPGWDSTTLVRKILRIDVSQQDPGRMYRIPTDNPWFNVSNPAVRKEIYSFGFRNTYSLGVNYLTGAIYGSETGQTRWEEINRIQPGANYGWNQGGDASTYGSNSNGIEGPCHMTVNGTRAMSTSTQAGGYTNGSFLIPYTRTMTGVSYAGTYTCANFTNPKWALRAGNGGDGLASSLPAQPAAVTAISPAFRGDPSSPFYGYQFITDIADRGYTAAKDSLMDTTLAPGAVELQRVGTGPANIGGIAFSGCGNHNGPTDFAEDSYGNLYVNYMSSNAAGSCQRYDLFRLYHANLTPLSTPRDQVFPPVSIRKPSGRLNRGEGAMVNSAMAGLALDIPKGYSGADLYNVKGRLVWSYRGNESSVRVPRDVEMGILQVKFVR